MRTAASRIISGFRVYYNSPADKLMDVSGYSIDFNAFKQAVVAYNSKNRDPISHLLFDTPMTVFGEQTSRRPARKRSPVALRVIISTAMPERTSSPIAAVAT